MSGRPPVYALPESFKHLSRTQRCMHFRCCESRAEAVQHITRDADIVMMNSPPDIASTNRWLKLYRPLCRFLAGIIFNCMRDPLEKLTNSRDASNGVIQTVEALLIGMEQDAVTYQVAETARLKQAP